MAGGSTAVIGAGIAGLCAADGLRRTGQETVVYDARRTWGGHISSDRFAGHWFDEGPHLSFTRDERVRALFERGVGPTGGVHQLPVRITNWFEGHWFGHPAADQGGGAPRPSAAPGRSRGTRSPRRTRAARPSSRDAAAAFSPRWEAR